MNVPHSNSLARRRQNPRRLGLLDRALPRWTITREGEGARRLGGWVGGGLRSHLGDAPDPVGHQVAVGIQAARHAAADAAVVGVEAVILVRDAVGAVRLAEGTAMPSP